MTRLQELEALRDKAKSTMLDKGATLEQARNEYEDAKLDLAAAEMLLSIVKRKTGRADS